IQNNALKTGSDDQPLTVAEVFRTLTDGVWREYPMPKGEDGKKAYNGSVIRRNLQRQHLKDLTDLVLGKRRGGFEDYYIFFGARSSVPPDARSLARMHLREIQTRISRALDDRQGNIEDTVRAHLEECSERIGRVLSASLQVNEQ